MKNAMISMFALMLSFTAQATSLHPDTFAKYSTMENIQVEGNSSISFTGGMLKLNAVSKQLELTLNRSFRCAQPGHGKIRCLSMPAPVTVTLPIIATYETYCGSTVYVARKDNRRADGVLNEVRVLDHSTMTCEIPLNPNRMTVVEYVHSFYDRLNRGEVTWMAKIEKALRSTIAQGL